MAMVEKALDPMPRGDHWQGEGIDKSRLQFHTFSDLICGQGCSLTELLFKKEVEQQIEKSIDLFKGWFANF